MMDSRPDDTQLPDTVRREIGLREILSKVEAVEGISHSERQDIRGEELKARAEGAV
jgi:hypothetical protein